MSRSVSLRFLGGVLAASLLLSPAAWAADIRVSYDVDQGALKDAVSGTSLTFALYSDSACSSPVASQSAAVDDVTPVEVIKSFKPKKGEKPLKVARLNHVLTGVTPAPELYLTVTGTGISPIGGVCQVQSVGAQGASGPAGTSFFMGRINDFPGSGDPDWVFASPVGTTDQPALDGNFPSNPPGLEFLRVAMLSPSFPIVITKLTVRKTSTAALTTSLSFRMLAFDDTGFVAADMNPCTINAVTTSCSTSVPSATVPAASHIVVAVLKRAAVSAQIDFSWEATTP